MTEQKEITTETNEKMHFHLVLAEVVYMVGEKATSHRVQFITQANINGFPADRITQLQNSAGLAVLQKLPKKDARNYKVLDVLFLNLTYCGHMTHADFYGKGTTTAVELVEEVASKPVSPGETAPGKNVVKMPRQPN